MKQAFPPAARIAVACGCALFASMWLLVATGAGSAADDRLHRLFLLDAGTPSWLLALLRFVTTLGGVAFLATLGLLCAVIFLARRNWDVALLLVVTLGGGRLLAAAIKLLIARARPELGDHLVTVHSLSFPSEHAFNSTVAYGLLALLSGSRPAYVAAFTTALLIGVSRILLGVHWPTDVVAGWSLGAAWLSLCWGLSKGRPHHRSAP